MAIPSRHDQEEGSGDTEAVLGPVSYSRTHWPFEHPGAAILAEAARPPRAALVSLSAMIERRSREVLASSQEPRAWQDTSLTQKLRRLDLSPSLREAAKEFQAVRNRIVHGYSATDQDALRAIDIGLELLNAIERLPHEIHVVIEPRVEVFQDENRETSYQGFHGVLPESISQARTSKMATRRSIKHASRPPGITSRRAGRCRGSG